MTKLRAKMIKQMKIRRFSEKTQQKYISSVANLALYYQKSPDLLNEEEVHDYLLHLMSERKLAWSTCNVASSAINFFYQVTLAQHQISIKIPPRKSQKKLPQVLSNKEIEHLFNATANQKHQTLLMTTYAGGLRVSELVRLKPIHIESDRMLIRVEQGKGNKDRYTLLSERLLLKLRDYWKVYSPKIWLFPGRNPDKPLTTKSAENAYNIAKQKAGIQRGRGIHTLRHCFATHLLEAGTDLRTIQMLMGHRSIITTMIYIQITRKKLTTVKSPLDLINFPKNS